MRKKDNDIYPEHIHTHQSKTMHTEIEDENCCEAFSINSKDNKLILKNNSINNQSPTKLKRINDRSSFKSVNKLIKLTSESTNQLSGLLTTSLNCNVIKFLNSTNSSTNLISELNSNNCLNSCELTSSNLSNNLIMVDKNCLNCSTTNLTSLKNCYSSFKDKQQNCKLSIQNKSSSKLCASRSSAINDHSINNMDLISIEFIKILFLSFFKSINNFTRNNQFIIVPLLLILFTIRASDACSARSTPKPRPPIPEIRPNITFQTYQCPEAYAKWYCLNGATCFFVRIGESILYNCECADGYMGQRCEFKDLEGSYLQSREKVLIETAQVTGGLSVIVVLLMFIALIFFANYKKRKSNRTIDEHANQFPFIT